MAIARTKRDCLAHAIKPARILQSRLCGSFPLSACGGTGVSARGTSGSPQDLLVEQRAIARMADMLAETLTRALPS
jgi:hypothetical protein